MSTPQFGRRIRRSIAAAGLGALALAGCSTPYTTPSVTTPAVTTPGATVSPTASTPGTPTVSPPSPTATSTATSTRPTSTATATGPDIPFASGAQSAPASNQGQDMLISTVRVGSTIGFDRVVVEYSRGTGLPGWQARWTTVAHTQGKGDVIDLPGATNLVVTLYGMAMDADAVIVRGNQNLATGVVRGVYVDPAFEAQAQLVIGLDAERPYRVFTLTAPTRLVIDFRTS